MVKNLKKIMSKKLWEEEFNEIFSHEFWTEFVKEHTEGRGWKLQPLFDFIEQEKEKSYNKGYIKGARKGRKQGLADAFRLKKIN